MNEGRRDFSIAVIADGVLVCGGYASSIMSLMEQFDPELGVDSGANVRSTPRCFSRRLDDQLYMCGGWNRVPMSPVECIDPTRNTSERLTSMTHARSRGSAVVIDGQLFTCGGHGADATLKTAEWFEPATRRWKLLPEMRQRRFCTHLAVISC